MLTLKQKAYIALAMTRILFYSSHILSIGIENEKNEATYTRSVRQNQKAVLLGLALHGHGARPGALHGADTTAESVPY